MAITYEYLDQITRGAAITNQYYCMYNTASIIPRYITYLGVWWNIVAILQWGDQLSDGPFDMFFFFWGGRGAFLFRKKSALKIMKIKMAMEIYTGDEKVFSAREEKLSV